MQQLWPIERTEAQALHFMRFASETMSQHVTYIERSYVNLQEAHKLPSDTDQIGVSGVLDFDMFCVQPAMMVHLYLSIFQAVTCARMRVESYCYVTSCTPELQAVTQQLRKSSHVVNAAKVKHVRIPQHASVSPHSLQAWEQVAVLQC